MRSYAEVIRELQEKAIVAIGGDFYDFDDFPLNEEFENFFHFGQEYLDCDNLDFSVAPARLYFNTNTSVNALARTAGEYYLIEIYKGAIFWIHHFYVEKEDRFNNEALSHFRDITNRKGINPGFFLFQFVSIYFFYHEVGHLIQRTKSDNDYLEFANIQLTSDQIRIRHMRELDADWYSAHCIAMHVIQFAEEETKDGSAVTTENLIEVASLALSGLYLYYIDQASHQSAEIYYEEYTHPHPSVRLSYMINFFLDNLQGNSEIQIDKNEILRNAIRVSELLTVEGNNNIIKQYSIALYKQLDKVEEYILNIIRNTDAYPSLCVHILG